MAALAVAVEKTLTATPFLMKSYKITATASSNNDITHNGPGVPDMVWCQSIGASGTPNAIFDVTATTATLISVDALGTDDFMVYAIWFNQVAQDGDSIS